MNGRPCNTLDVILPLGDGAKLDDNNLKLQKISGDRSCLYHALLHLYLNPTIGNAPANPVYTTLTSARDIRNAILQYFVANSWLVQSGWFGQRSNDSSEETIENFKNELLDEDVFGDARMVQLFSLMTTTVIHTYQLEEDSNTISQAVESYYPCPSNNPAELYTREQLDRFPVLVLAYKSTGTGSDTMASNNSRANHYDAIVKVENYIDETIKYPLHMMDVADEFIEDGNVLEDDLKDRDEDMDVPEDEGKVENKDGKNGAGKSGIVDGKNKAKKEKYEWTKKQVKYNPFLNFPSVDQIQGNNQPQNVKNFQANMSTLIGQCDRIHQLFQVEENDEQKRALNVQMNELIKEIIQKLRNFEVECVFDNFIRTVHSDKPYSIDVEVRKDIKKIFIVDMMKAPDIDKSRVEIEHFYLRMAHIFRDYKPNITQAAGGSNEKDIKNIVEWRTSRYLNLTVKDPYCHVQIYVVSENVVQFKIDTPMAEYNADNKDDRKRAKDETYTKIEKILENFETLLERSNFPVTFPWRSALRAESDKDVAYAKFDLKDIVKEKFPDDKCYNKQRPKELNVFSHARMLGLRDWFDTVIVGLNTKYNTIPLYPGYRKSDVELLQNRITQCCKEREENKKNPMEGKMLMKTVDRTGDSTSQEDRLKDINRGLKMKDKDIPNCNMRTGRFTYRNVWNEFVYQSSNANCQIYAFGKVDIQDYDDHELETIVRTVIFWTCLAKNDAIRSRFTDYMTGVINIITSKCGLHGHFEKYLEGMQDNFQSMCNDEAADKYFNTNQKRGS
tara:strand:+ start:1999 stop:4353 length:2355 start_codon:yes stop_codon:yes gene_type:complete